MTIDQILEALQPPKPLSEAETRLRRVMIRSAVEERTCRDCQSLASVVSLRKGGTVVGFLCSHCGLKWGVT